MNPGGKLFWLQGEKAFAGGGGLHGSGRQACNEIRPAGPVPVQLTHYSIHWPEVTSLPHPPTGNQIHHSADPAAPPISPHPALTQILHAPQTFGCAAQRESGGPGVALQLLRTHRALGGPPYCAVTGAVSALLPPAVDLRGGHGNETPLWFMLMRAAAHFGCSGFMYLLSERLYGILHDSYRLASSRRSNPASFCPLLVE
ncbi:hypothetical protein BD779DRAFT_1782670 [Infundibulicybe gibba]|nr:hypothetical protein BD779DRAFT_1782670 [Infundibulicybe gibba]